MSIIEAGAAFRTWTARHGLAPNAATAQVAEEIARSDLVAQLDAASSDLEPTLMQAVNAVAANEAEGESTEMRS